MVIRLLKGVVLLVRAGEIVEDLRGDHNGWTFDEMIM
jgi:hypothetical protein